MIGNDDDEEENPGTEVDVTSQGNSSVYIEITNAREGVPVNASGNQLYAKANTGVVLTGMEVHPASNGNITLEILAANTPIEGVQYPEPRNDLEDYSFFAINLSTESGEIALTRVTFLISSSWLEDESSSSSDISVVSYEGQTWQDRQASLSTNRKEAYLYKVAVKPPSQLAINVGISQELNTSTATSLKEVTENESPPIQTTRSSPKDGAVEVPIGTSTVPSTEESSGLQVGSLFILLVMIVMFTMGYIVVGFVSFERD